MSFTVEELIKKLKEMPQKMYVRIETLSKDCGEVKRVIPYEDENVVVLESNEE